MLCTVPLLENLYFMLSRNIKFPCYVLTLNKLNVIYEHYRMFLYSTSHIKHLCILKEENKCKNNFSSHIIEFAHCKSKEKFSNEFALQILNSLVFGPRVMNGFEPLFMVCIEPEDRLDHPDTFSLQNHTYHPEQRFSLHQKSHLSS